jgi:O-methyltransferase
MQLRDTINATANIQLLINCMGLTENVPGEIWECGVFKGGSASVICNSNKIKKVVRLFDTFGPGIPTSGEFDTHEIGDFEITYEEYCGIVDYFNKFPNVYIHRGIIPETFKYLDKCQISLCHVDLDQYDGYKATLEFVFPRMPIGGIFVFDDYKCNSTPGATKAVDDFCAQYNQTVRSGNYHSNYGGYLIKL